MASQNKRPLIEAEIIGNKKRRRNDSGGGNDEFVAPDAFTEDLLEIVCSYLPVLSAARMSLVSPRFRNLWKHCKNIVFNRPMVRGITEDKVIMAMDTALSMHEGPKIDKFSIFVSTSGIESLLDEWIEIAVSKNVEEIELDYTPNQFPQPLPVGLSKSPSVRSLKLINLELKKPRRMQQEWVTMTMLKDLRLRNCELKFFKAVFSRCQQLEYLEIVRCTNVRMLWLLALKHRNFRTLKIIECLDLVDIRMHAPTLKVFHYQGSIQNIVMIMKGRMPKLERAFVSYYPTMSNVPENLFTKLLVGSAKSLNVLSVNSVFIEGMSPLFRQGDPVTKEIVFPNLTELEICMEDYTYETSEYLHYFLKCCPRLEILLIDLGGFQDKGEGLFHKVETNTEQTTNLQQFLHLKDMKVIGFNPSQQEHDLLKYLVARSPALETLVMVTSQDYIHRGPSLKFLCHLRYNAVSPFMKLLFYNYGDDQSCISSSLSKT